MNKLLADEFFALWSTPDTLLTEEQLGRQAPLYYQLEDSDRERFDRLRFRAVEVRNRDYPGQY